MTNEEIKDKLLTAGVKNLKEFGYPDVTKENILTDEIYSAFFENMLDDNRGQGNRVDAVIDELFELIKK